MQCLKKARANITNTDRLFSSLFSPNIEIHVFGDTVYVDLFRFTAGEIWHVLPKTEEKSKAHTL